MGSFSKATVDRMINNTSLRGRSYCVYCKKSLRWYDLIPLFSYLLLKGRCRFCRKNIPIENLLFEAVLGIIVGVLFWVTVLPDIGLLISPAPATIIFLLDLIFKLFVIVVLAIIFWVDLKTGLIPDRLTYPAIIAAIFYLLLLSGLKSFIFYQSLQGSLLGEYLMPPVSNYFLDHLQRIWTPVFLAIGSAVVLSGVFAFLIIITKGKGMGWGDVKYVGFLGLVLGFPESLAAVFLAFLAGAIISLGLMALRIKRLGQTVPFGPFLSFGALIALFFGRQIIDWYLRIF